MMMAAKKIIMGRSRLCISAGKLKGKSTAVPPITIRRLKRLLPMILPMSRSDSSRRMAEMQEANSGNEVPTAAMVRPITRAGTWKKRAISFAPAIKKSDPLARQISPAILRNIMRGREGLGESVSVSSAI